VVPRVILVLEEYSSRAFFITKNSKNERSIIMKKHAIKLKTPKNEKEVTKGNESLNYFGAGRLLDYLDA
jgi:hypothetical protein